MAAKISELSRASAEVELAAAEEPEPAPENRARPAAATARSAHLRGGVQVSERFCGDASKYQRIAEASGIATLA